jgi:hypothetical protein
MLFMKKILVVMLIVILVIAVGFGIFFLIRGEVAFEDVLPEGPVLYVKFSDVEAHVKRLTATKLWDSLRRIDYSLLGGKDQARQRETILRTLQQAGSNPTAQAVLRKMFGNEFAFVIYPVSLDIAALLEGAPGSMANLTGEITSSVFLITRIDPTIQFAESLAGFLNQGGSGPRMETVFYGKYQIHMVTLLDVGMKLAFVRIKDILVIGIGDKPLRSIVDVYQGRQKALRTDSRFQKVMRGQGKSASQSAGDGKAGLSGYLDTGRLITTLKKEMHHFLNWQEEAIRKTAADAPEEAGPKIAEAKRQWEEGLKRLAGFESFAFAAYLGDIPTFKFDVLMNKAAWDPQMAASYACPPAENGTLRFVPQEALGYYWDNCFDFNEFWGQIKEGIASVQREAGRPVMEDVPQVMGMDLEKDILPVFGHEIGGYLKGIQAGGAFPIPHILFFVKIKDKEGAGRLLTAIGEQVPFILQEEDYKGIKIKYVVSPLGEEVQPGYCVLGDYWLVAIQRQTLKTSIDAYNDPSRSLPGAPAFQKIDFGLSGPNRWAMFARVGEIAHDLEGAIEWGKTWIASQDTQKDAFRSGSERRLADVEKEIAAQKEELVAAKSRIAALDDEIWDRQSRGIDVSALQAEMDQLKEGVKTLEGGIALSVERKREMAEIIHGYKGGLADKDNRDTILEGVIRPLLKSLVFIKTLGARMTLQDETLETILFLKVE